MNIYDYQQKYRQWWRGKLCRLMYSTGPFKRVDDVKVHGPPSFVYGFAELIYEDGTTENVMDAYAFRSRKMDVEVKQEPEEKKS
jgi:hypothetical protein